MSRERVTHKPPAMKIMMIPSLVGRGSCVLMNAQKGIARTRRSVKIVRHDTVMMKAPWFIWCWAGCVFRFQYESTGMVVRTHPMTDATVRQMLMTLTHCRCWSASLEMFPSGDDHEFKTGQRVQQSPSCVAADRPR